MPEPRAQSSDLRQRARSVAIAIGATIAWGLLLLIAFDPGVQQLDPEDLVERSGDARAFFAADFVFVALYAVLVPVAIRRFGEALAGGGAPTWIKVGALALILGGVVDAAENTLLLSATGSVSSGPVDCAHALAVPKVVLFVVGAAVALAVLVRAIRVLRAR